MNSLDLSPLYRSSIGFDRIASLLDPDRKVDTSASDYPPYNIELVDEKRYSIELALAGFELRELDIKVDGGILMVNGEKADSEERQFLYNGIANQAFKRKFSLAEHVEVTGANFTNGLLTIHLVKEIPEAMKPKSIAISHDSNMIDGKPELADDTVDKAT